MNTKKQYLSTWNLTLTSVVFELAIYFLLALLKKNLTLTSVVFELMMLIMMAMM